MLDAQQGLMEEIRGHFAHVESCPITGERIFFENAGGALSLHSVIEASHFYAGLPDNQGRDNPASQHSMTVIAQGKADMMRFFGAETGMAFVGESGTEVLYRLISAACLNAKGAGNLVGSTLEHPASASAGAQWADWFGLENRRAIHDDETGTVTLDAYIPLIDENTKVVTIVHTSPVTGIGVDVKAIIAHVRKVAPDCFIIIDGIQHAAHGSVGLDELDIDGYAISPYKVFSRHGYGVGWVSDRLAKLPHNRLLGAPDAQWELGTRDTGAYATFSKMVDYLVWLGTRIDASNDTPLKMAGKAIASHEFALCDLLLNGEEGLNGLADHNGAHVIGGRHNQLREGLVCFAIEGVETAKIVAHLNENGIRTHIRKNDHYCGNVLGPLGLGDAVRVSFCHYNTKDEVRKFLNVIKSL